MKAITLVTNPDRCQLLSEEVAVIDGQVQHFAVWRREGELQIWCSGQVYIVPIPGISRKKRKSPISQGGLVVESKMPGTILKLLAEQGDLVVAGQPLILMESMKMEMSLESPTSGRIAAILCKAGERVDRGSLLIRLVAEG